MSHTKGPWHHNVDEAGNNPDICVTNRAGDILCDIGGGKFETRLANAKLMAAAPDLLAACEDMLDYIKTYGPARYPGEYDKWQAAIAKAKGKESSHG